MLKYPSFVDLVDRIQGLYGKTLHELVPKSMRKSVSKRNIIYGLKTRGLKPTRSNVRSVRKFGGAPGPDGKLLWVCTIPWGK